MNQCTLDGRRADPGPRELRERAAGLWRKYRGVRVIDLDGEKIIRLRTYCDSAALMLVQAMTG